MKENTPHPPDIFEGLVTGLGEYYAYIDLINQAGKAVVHISQLSNRFDPPPMSDYLAIGSLVRGIVVGHDSRSGRLEISPRLLNLNSSPRSQEILDWTVTYANDFESVLVHQDLVGILKPSNDRWCRYRVLREGGILVDGTTIAARPSGKVDEDNREILRLPLYREQSTTICPSSLTGEIIFWRRNATRKKDQMLRNILYAHTERGYLFRLECNNVLSIEEHFCIGDSVSFSPAESFLNGINLGELVENSKIIPQNRSFKVGEKASGKIVRLLPGGALVLVGDGQEAFLLASTILPGKGFIGSVLKVGDWVEAKFLELTDRKGKAGLLSFVRLTTESDVSNQNRNPLIDIRSERRSTTKGGLGRNSSFRAEVTDKYGHICCFCGESFRSTNSSAMQAAHIIPRGKRGADHPKNGLCICPIHHWAFDRGLISIDEVYKVIVAKHVQNEKSTGEWLTKLHGRPAVFSSTAELSVEALAWHRKNIFIGETYLS